MKNDYVWQKVNDAVDALLWTDDPERAQYAFIALGNLLPAHCTQLDDEERALWTKLQGYLGREGSGLDIARAMSPAEKRDFADTLWNLCGRLERDVWSSNG